MYSIQENLKTDNQLKNRWNSIHKIKQKRIQAMKLRNEQRIKQIQDIQQIDAAQLLDICSDISDCIEDFQFFEEMN